MQKQMLNKTLNLPTYGIQNREQNDMRQIKRSHSSNNDPDILKV